MLHPSRTATCAALLTATLSGPATADPPRAPRVSRMLLSRASQERSLYAGDTVVATYRASLGPGGPGTTTQEEIDPIAAWVKDGTVLDIVDGGERLTAELTRVRARNGGARFRQGSASTLLPVG